MTKRYSANERFEVLVEEAKRLDLPHHFIKKGDLAASINAKLDEIEQKENTIEINIFEAQDVLTDTEMEILFALINKIEKSNEKRAFENMMLKFSKPFFTTQIVDPVI